MSRTIQSLYYKNALMLKIQNTRRKNNYNEMIENVKIYTSDTLSRDNLFFM